jgi:hypothetical protein
MTQVADNVFLVDVASLPTAEEALAEYDRKQAEKSLLVLARGVKFNENHEPAGSPEGGRFASGPGGGASPALFPALADTEAHEASYAAKVEVIEKALAGDHRYRDRPFRNPEDRQRAVIATIEAYQQAGPTGVAVQLAARAEFKPTGTATGWRPEESRSTETRSAMGDGRMRAVLRAQYDVTQARLAGAGVKELEVHRGMGWQQEAPEMPKWIKDMKVGETRTVMVKSLPLTSFSSDRALAAGYAQHRDSQDPRGRVTAVASVVIPAERIASIGSTGMGRVEDNEVVVIGGEIAMQVTRTH